MQGSILQESAVLGRLQKEAAEKIDQTLNPLFPMKMDLTVEMKADENTPELNRLTDYILSRYPFLGTLPDSVGLERSYIRKGNWISLDNNAKNRFQKEAAAQTISIQFDRRANGKREVMFCYVPEGYFNDLIDSDDAAVFYNVDENYFLVQYTNIPVRMVDRRGTGFKSTSQLPDSRMTVIVTRMPGNVIGCNITYKFPPDFSIIHKLQSNGSISTMQTPLLGPYVLQYTTESVRYRD